MRRRLYFLAVFVVATALVGVGLAGTTAAQTDSPINESVTGTTGSDAEVMADGTEAGTLANQQSIQLTEYTEIVAWEFSNGEVRIAVDSTRRERVILADAVAGMGEAGATRVPQTEYLVHGEVLIIIMSVEEAMGGHAVGVSAGGSTVRLSTEMTDAGDDPFQYFGGESGLFSGMLLAIFTSLGAAGYVLWREDSGVIKA